MPRLYPRFIFSNPADTKSEGPFLVHLLEPRFVAKVIATPNAAGFKIDVLDSWGSDPVELNSSLEQASNWLIQQLRKQAISF